ncbi:hypothetical protein K456DRAFT_432371 [Colletotrichum gloeosporioides 23]|nr:hypothetical protein K456DRAFT_432371 [Colletotrichum gloeosporioides 23]
MIRRFLSFGCNGWIWLWYRLCDTSLVCLFVDWAGLDMHHLAAVMQVHGESSRPVRWAPRHRPEKLGVTIGLAAGGVVSSLNMSSHIGTGTDSFTQRLLSTTHLAVSLPTYLTPAEMQAISNLVQFVEPLPRRRGLPYAPPFTRVTTTSCGTWSSSAPSYFSP